MARAWRSGARLACGLVVPELAGDLVTLGSKGAYQITALAYAHRARLLVACCSHGELYAWDLDGAIGNFSHDWFGHRWTAQLNRRADDEHRRR
ncbi:hypothetical protein [Actinomadura sp. HBU206391]|uniref:hypothetical protein n=1 Tax=Actinomadura sp. HBU206391 TaxID=2731692 RepID=UPI0016501D42|nr:hypothetical protein [Actinomadura sp. HBU206391]MBC6458073.1 hypothetical protein [Actinomadura sp. HBU206391]